MDERSGQLDQPFVKRAVGPLAVWQPHVFQHIVGFIIFLTVETIEIAKVVGRKRRSLKPLDEFCHVTALLAHNNDCNACCSLR
jgi:hypothetical protein